MTIEALWYSSYVDGEAPHMRRLARQPLPRQWEAAIDLAIAYADGSAGYRSVGRNSLTREETWHWPQADGQWWLIPHRIDRRCMAIVDAATRCELRRGRGRASRSSHAAHVDLRKAHVRLTVYGDEVLKYKACRGPHEALMVAYDQLHKALTPQGLQSMVLGLVRNAFEAGKREGREEVQQGLRRLAGLERWEG